MEPIDITITRVKHGYFEYTTIYRGLYVRKLYDTNDKRTNKEDFIKHVTQAELVWQDKRTKHNNTKTKTWRTKL